MIGFKKLLGYCMLITGLHATGQPSLQYSLDSLAGAFIQNIRNTESLQSYIHTDKSIYRIRETIWIRAFLLNSLSQRISTRSSLIVELVNSNDTVIKQILLDAPNQQYTGKILLPATMPSGFYWLRGYTIEMTRSNSGKVFSHPIYVINQSGPPAVVPGKKDIADIKQPLQIRFFPEGGSIMTGTNSLVGLQISDKSGNPVQLSGSIRDNRDSMVAQFSSNELGLGQFEFFPYRARRYMAKFKYRETNYEYPLPPFNFFAGQVAIISSEKGIKRVRVLLEDSIYKKDFVTFLIGISRDSLCFAGIGKGNYELNIPLSQFPRGIATLYLFDQQKRLLSERSFYVQEENALVNVTPENPVYGKRSRVVLAVSVTDAQKQPLTSSMSISVAEKSLTSVEQPALLYEAFFQYADPVIRQWAVESAPALHDSTLQLLMLTNTSAFIQSTDHWKSQSADDSLFMSGKITVNGKTAANKSVTLFTEGQARIFETVTTDFEGRFRFPVNDLPDSTRFNVRLNSENGKPENFEITLDSFRLPRLAGTKQGWPTFILHPSTISGYSAKWDPAFSGTGKEWLEPVLVNSKRNKDLLYESKRVSSSSFIIPHSAFEKGGNGSVRNAVMRTPGLAIYKGYLVVRGLNSTTDVTARAEPIIALNGIVVYLPGEDISGVSPVLNFLNSLNPSDIEFIEVLRGPEGATFGSRGGNGVIVIHTSNMLITEPDTKNNLKSFYARGYHNPALFQSPNYEIKELKAAPNTDSRSTLYWNGNLLTNEKGKAEIAFFTNDIPGVYVVTIRGISVRGDIIYKTLEFSVR